MIKNPKWNCLMMNWRPNTRKHGNMAKKWISSLNRPVKRSWLSVPWSICWRPNWLPWIQARTLTRPCCLRSSMSTSWDTTSSYSHGKNDTTRTKSAGEKSQSSSSSTISRWRRRQPKKIDTSQYLTKTTWDKHVLFEIQINGKHISKTLSISIKF